MTKEEIINKHWDDPTNLLDSVPKMMEQYAKQESIDFLNWDIKRKWNRIFKMEKEPTIPETAEMLYELYQQSKTESK